MPKINWLFTQTMGWEINGRPMDNSWIKKIACIDLISGIMKMVCALSQVINEQNKLWADVIKNRKWSVDNEASVFFVPYFQLYSWTIFQ